MPIYEYRCKKCGKRFSVLTLRVSEKAVPVCDKCGSKSADRLLSRFAMPKSEEARLDRLSDPSSMSGLDENDPKSVAKFMKKMGQEMGEDVGDLEQAMEEEMAGGGMGGDEGGMGGGMGSGPGGPLPDDL